jgi:hypothetical protein
VKEYSMGSRFPSRRICLKFDEFEKSKILDSLVNFQQMRSIAPVVLSFTAMRKSSIVSFE